ncbi:unnamed protein product, partial [Staurois parvus]
PVPPPPPSSPSRLATPPSIPPPHAKVLVGGWNSVPTLVSVGGGIVPHHWCQ